MSTDTPQIHTCIHFDWTNYYTEATEKKNQLMVLTTLVDSLSLSSHFSFTSSSLRLNVNKPKVLAASVA